MSDHSYPLVDFSPAGRLSRFGQAIDAATLRVSLWLSRDVAILPELTVKRVGGLTFVKFGRFSGSFTTNAKPSVSTVDLSRGRVAKRFATFVRGEAK